VGGKSGVCLGGGGGGCVGGGFRGGGKQGSRGRARNGKRSCYLAGTKKLLEGENWNQSSFQRWKEGRGMCLVSEGGERITLFLGMGGDSLSGKMIYALCVKKK